MHYMIIWYTIFCWGWGRWNSTVCSVQCVLLCWGNTIMTTSHNTHIPYFYCYHNSLNSHTPYFYCYRNSQNNSLNSRTPYFYCYCNSLNSCTPLAIFTVPVTPKITPLTPVLPIFTVTETPACPIINSQ